MNVHEPALFLDLQRGGGRSFSKTGWLYSLCLHVLAIAALLTAPKSVMQTHHLFSEIRRTTPLIAPPSQLTQRTPNRGQVGQEIDLQSLLPRPRIQIPAGPPSSTRPAASIPSPVLKPEPIPEPPRMEAAARSPEPPALGMPVPIQAPPQIQQEEKPKIAFETPGAAVGAPAGTGRGKIAIPGSSVTEAVRSLAHSGRSGGITVGDAGEGIGGIGPGLNLPPSPGTTKSNLELLSDPMGVDFRPYLIQVLAAVRRNWVAVIPESARLGQQAGRVQVQFALNRGGKVIKLVIATSSGARALDLAAVAGISASDPLPPLPTEYRGDQLRLQLTFLYNIR